MQAIEFETRFDGGNFFDIPPAIAKQLPPHAKLRIIVLCPEDAEDEQWKRASYEAFLKEDPAEDAAYESLR